MYPGDIELKKVLANDFIGIIAASSYTPTYRLTITDKKVKVGIRADDTDTKTLFSLSKEEELMMLPEGLVICLNAEYQVIGIKYAGDINYDNFFAYSKMVPFPCAPVERVKDNKPMAILEYLVALPDASWNCGRVGILPASGNMIHLNGRFIAPMVFLSLSAEYKQLLKSIPESGFEAVLYYIIRKELPHIADRLIGTDRFTVRSYQDHVRTWL